MLKWWGSESNRRGQAYETWGAASSTPHSIVYLFIVQCKLTCAAVSITALFTLQAMYYERHGIASVGSPDFHPERNFIVSNIPSMDVAVRASRKSAPSANHVRRTGGGRLV